MSLDAVLSRLDADLDASLERLFALLRIPSISTDPAYAADCRRAAEHLAADLASIGFAARVAESEGHPIVLADGDGMAADASAPRALFYGHYDVQPVDPLELWKSGPFEPQVEDQDGRKVIRARGAADDKGQLMTFIEACRAWKAETGALPLRVGIMLEGEEECSSPSLPAFFEKHAEELRRDLAFVCDTGMWDRETPAITTMLRGLMGDEVIVHAASRDLHSGMYGSAAANPIRVLARILADLHDETGRVTLPGFYDGVPELSDEVAGQWRGLNFSPESFLGEIGLSIPAGETGRSALEQIWSRPTLEINGVSGGYAGEGFKTVIPAQASAKISCRLVGTQDPHAIRASLRAHIEARLPADCRAEFIEHGSSPATVMDVSAPAFGAAREALGEEWGRPAPFIGCGGSIPIVGRFQETLDMPSLLVGFGLDDDQVHSPNEKYDLESFRKGARSWARILAALA